LLAKPTPRNVNLGSVRFSMFASLIVYSACMMHTDLSAKQSENDSPSRWDQRMF